MASSSGRQFLVESRRNFREFLGTVDKTLVLHQPNPDSDFPRHFLLKLGLRSAASHLAHVLLLLSLLQRGAKQVSAHLLERDSFGVSRGLEREQGAE